MPSMWIAAGFSFAMFGTLAGVSFSSTPSFAARIITGSSIITTDRYCFALFDSIFSRFTSDLVPSKTILQLYFFSNMGDGALHERLVARRAADHDLLGLRPYDGGETRDGHRSTRARSGKKMTAREIRSDLAHHSVFPRLLNSHPRHRGNPCANR